MRLAFIVSHPIQYYVPIYRELAKLAGQRTTGPQDHGTAESSRRVAKQPTDTGQSDDALADDGLLNTDDSARISALKVFYTWRDAGPARDVKFGKEFAWEDAPAQHGTHQRR